MKVLQINSCYGIFSTGKIVKDLENIIIASGDECKCIFGRSGKTSKNSFKFNNAIDKYIHVSLSRITDKSGMYSHGATKKMIEFIKKYSPDIIHLHNIHGYYLNIEILFDFLKEYNRPVVWTLHDCWSFTGHCSHFDFIGCDKWKSGCFACPQKKQYPSSILCDNSKNNYNIKKHLFTSLNKAFIVTPSEWLGNLVKQSYLNKYPINVINNGIDTGVFKPKYGNVKEKYGLKNKKVVLGVASTWDSGKGLNDFVKLSKQLSSEYKIVLIGLDDRQKKQIPNEITGISRTANAEELAKWYTAADVFVNPTYEDTYPTVNLEAQSCGTYVISYDTGGCKETIAHGCGETVDRGDINELLKRIMQKVQRVDINSEIFDKSNCFKKYLNLYNSLINGKE